MNDKALLDSIQSEKNKFIIQIKSKENSTWQGTVEWVEKKQVIPFRSALELMCLIESAMSDSEA